MLLKESTLRNIIRKALMSEVAFSGLPGYAKNKEMDIYRDLMDPNNEELRKEIFKLIDKSYSYLGGNADIKTVDDLKNKEKNDYIFFKAWDIDEDPEPDVVRGMKPKAGKTKLTLSATDGLEASVAYGINDSEKRLRDGQHYAEMSGRAATVQMKRGVPAVTNETTAQSLLPGKSIQWFGEHPYFSGDPRFQDNGSKIEAQKSKQYGPNGEYDGWYVRDLGGTPKAKIIFGNI